MTLNSLSLSNGIVCDILFLFKNPSLYFLKIFQHAKTTKLWKKMGGEVTKKKKKKKVTWAQKYWGSFRFFRSKHGGKKAWQRPSHSHRCHGEGWKWGWVRGSVLLRHLQSCHQEFRPQPWSPAPMQGERLPLEGCLTPQDALRLTDNFRLYLLLSTWLPKCVLTLSSQPHPAFGDF